MNLHDRKKQIKKAAEQVGPGVFYSTLVVITSFLPVFLLTGMEGKLFHPLAWTKSIILLIDAFVAISLTPVLLVFLLKGKVRSENDNPVQGFFSKLYHPALLWSMKYKKIVLSAAFVCLFSGIWMLFNMGTEFMPPLDEGSILFMPVTLPDVSPVEAKHILQVQDKIIRSVPEVQSVLGKAGRANTATDNSPMSMIETIILLKPKKEWRAGLTKDDIISEINQKTQIPGVINGFTQPIINRINMLATGIRTDVGIKILGNSIDTIERLSDIIAKDISNIQGVSDVYNEPLRGGKYIEIIPNRDQLAFYGLNMYDLNMAVETGLSGRKIGQLYADRKRFPIVIRLNKDFRSDIEAIQNMLIDGPNGSVRLKQLAEIQLKEGPAMINSEQAMLKGTVMFNIRGRDLGSTISEAKSMIDKKLNTLPKGYRIEWSGQWENQERAQRTLMMIIPLVLIIIFLVLYLTYHSWSEAMYTMLTVPFALVGGVFMIYAMHIHLSVAVAVGFIALFGIAVETAMLMTIYLDEFSHRLAQKHEQNELQLNEAIIRETVIQGATQRLRPKIMTVAVSLFGLIPVFWADGTGSDILKPITIPLIGGVLSSSFFVLFLTPIIYEFRKQRKFKKYGHL
jgi:Cu(I)/Ag(I) efflux system membrane protein CusA/SilA